MRKWTLFLVAALLAVFTITPLGAQDTAPDVFASAALTPATDEVYISIRLDDAYITTLNELYVVVRQALLDIDAPVEDLPALQYLLALALDPNATPENVDEVLAWAGDTVTITADTEEIERDAYTVFLPITDKQAALDSLNRSGMSLVESRTAGRFTVYDSERTADTALLLADDFLILTNHDPDLLAGGDYAKLSDAAGFVAARADLPADGYNAAFYIAASAVTTMQDGAAVINGDVLIGATLLDNKTLTLDVVNVPSTPAQPSQSVNSAFLRHIPANTTAFIHATDLSNLLNNAIALGEAQGNPNARAEFEQALLAAGLTLDDLLTWTKGDYAVFARADMPALLRAVADENTEALVTALDFGVTIEAADAVLAKQFSDKIASIIGAAIANQPGVALSTMDMNGTAVTRIEISAPMGLANLNFALGLGANDEVFAFGTFRAIEAIFSNAGGLDANGMYTESAAYLLPDATSVWYTDGQTLVAWVGLLGAGTLMPMSMSSTMQGALDMGNETAAARAQTIQNDDPTTQFLGVIERVSRLVRHATVSTAVSDKGAYIVRATLTIGE